MQKKQKKKQIKSTQADICLKCLKKSCLFTCMLFLKVFKKKSQRTKISGRKLLITSQALFFMHLFYAYKKYLEQKLFITS